MRRRKNYIQFTCRIEENLLEEIKRIVLDNELYSINSFINECLEFAIKENIKSVK